MDVDAQVSHHRGWGRVVLRARARLARAMLGRHRRIRSRMAGRRGRWFAALGSALLAMLLVLLFVPTTAQAAPGGEVAAWGSNATGATSVPAGLDGVVAIDVGNAHSLALKNDGTVAAWGDNSHGQLNVPAGLNNVTAISTGTFQNLALKSNGTVVTWGHDVVTWSVPAGLDNVTAVAAGANHFLALKNDGTVTAWGDSSLNRTAVPAGLNHVTAVAAGVTYSLALKDDGTVVAWGDNSFGSTDVPAGLNNVTAISGGFGTSMALKSDGTVVVWGTNNGVAMQPPAGLNNVVAISDGAKHGLALKGDGTVVAWGDNSDGQTNVPAALSGVTAISAGAYHNLALVPTVRVATTTMPSADVGVAYNAPLTAVGGVGPYTWSLVSGSLPSGLSLDAAGAVSGTPAAGTEGRTFQVTVQATDANQVTTAAPLSISVRSLSTITLTSSPELWQQGHSETITAKVTGQPGQGATASGTVTFEGGNLFPATTVALDSNGTASITTPATDGFARVITATYSGDSRYQGTVAHKSTTFTAPTASLSTKAGISVPLHANVLYIGVFPIGEITFLDGATVLGSVPVNGGTDNGFVTLNASFPAGTHSVTARYTTSDPTHQWGSISTPTTVTVATEPTVTTVASAGAWSPWQPVTLTATVGNQDANSSLAPTGTVTFKDGAVTVGTASLSNGQATVTVPPFGSGSHTVTAVYGGDGDHGNSTSTPLTQDSSKAATTTTLASSVNPASVSRPVTLTATVTSTSDTGQAPTGPVTFTDGSTQLGTGTLTPGPAGTATATFTTSSLTAGTHSVTAAYNGDATHNASTSDPLSQSVRAGTTTTVTSGTNPSAAGQQVTLTARVTGNLAAVPTGTVTFTDGTTALGAGPVTLAADGTATLTTPLATTGTHTITATYNGDTLYEGGSSGSLVQTVNDANSTTALTANPTTATAGQQITFTATVHGNTATNPTGTVTFTDNGTALQAPVTLGADGTATLTAPLTTAGAHTITATYNGDQIYTGSSSDPATVTVDAANSTTTLLSSQNPSSTGQDVTFTATVTGPTGPTPTGAVTFTDGTTALGTGPVTLTADGTATLTTSALTAGTHTITATYSGDQTYGTSSSDTLSQAVGEATSATALTASPDHSTAGQQIILTATVTGPGATSPTPTGAVTFTDNGTALQAPVTLEADGTATLRTTALSPGTHTIGAAFTGSLTYATSTSSATATVTVAPALSVTTTTLPDATDGTAYSATLTATGGLSPYTWHTTSGALPAGLTLDPVTGAISGTPTAATTTTFTVTVTDANGQTAAQDLTLTPGAAPTPTPTPTDTPAPSGSPSTSPSPSASPSASPTGTTPTGTTPEPSDSPSATPSPTSQAAPVTTTGGGPLAHTGASGTITIVILGVLLLAAGTLLYRKFRR